VQVFGFEPTQAPEEQVSVSVQELPSLQLAPSAFTGLVQIPVAGLQIPASWQESTGTHASAFGA
jgi:hypothetical protein